MLAIAAKDDMSSPTPVTSVRTTTRIEFAPVKVGAARAPFPRSATDLDVVYKVLFHGVWQLSCIVKSVNSANQDRVRSTGQSARKGC